MFTQDFILLLHPLFVYLHFVVLHSFVCLHSFSLLQSECIGQNYETLQNNSMLSYICWMQNQIHWIWEITYKISCTISEHIAQHPPPPIFKYVAQHCILSSVTAGVLAKSSNMLYHLRTCRTISEHNANYPDFFTQSQYTSHNNRICCQISVYAAQLPEFLPKLSICGPTSGFVDQS